MHLTTVEQGAPLFAHITGASIFNDGHIMRNTINSCYDVMHPLVLTEKLNTTETPDYLLTLALTDCGICSLDLDCKRIKIECVMVPSHLIGSVR